MVDIVLLLVVEIMLEVVLAAVARNLCLHPCPAAAVSTLLS